MYRVSGIGVHLKVLLIIGVLFLPPVPSTARDLARVKDVRVGTAGAGVRVVVEFDRLPEYSAHLLRKPDRLYFDLRGSMLSAPMGPMDVKRGPVRRVRISQYDDDTVRLVLDLEKVRDHKYFTLKSPPRLVVEIGKRENPFYRRRKVVVIDAGHGGHDPGAIGPRGLKEKDVTLDIALRLKRILEKRYNLDVHLTRKGDEYLDLSERTKIANRKEADLFVSIHNNASRKRRTRGIETYLLNWTNDVEAMKVAARENAISVERMKMARSELGMILASLERENKRDESLKLAHFIQGALSRRLSARYRGMEDLGVKQALFYVLLGAKMPSVLVEVGFISNPREERLLRTGRFRESAAEAIASGIYRYIRSLPDAPQLAMNR